jgi:cbb3-type cytochrome oxidase subunit 3
MTIERTKNKTMKFLIENAPTIATIFFFLCFCFAIYSVFKKGAKKKFDQYSQIPLKKD